jgi:hypothetical protein
MRMDPDDFKYGASFDPMEARRLLRKLEEAGVEFQIDVEATAGGFLGVNQAVAIYLHREHWARGMELLGLPPEPDDMVDGLPWDEVVLEPDDTPIESGMVLETGDRHLVRDPTAGDILRALQETDLEAGEIVILRHDAEHFLHATGGLELGYQLGFQDGGADRFFGSVRGELPLETAYQVFVDYLTRQPGWRDTIEWQRR